MKTRPLIAITIAALLLAGFGCGARKPSATPPPVSAPEAKPSSPGLPRQTQQQFDEDDHLDAALKDLETVQ
ncbi:MAG TPA: hypothetical protein VL500_03775 [Candidatus Eisenbacteria bacterium]|jgi:hypothetical protein|nr:hypothetical protein [Candidatus Eisenbacteria bacterium]